MKKTIILFPLSISLSFVNAQNNAAIEASIKEREQ